MTPQLIKKISIEDFLAANGYSMLIQEPRLTWYLPLDKQGTNPQLMVDNVRNCWYDFQSQHGGNIIDLACAVYGLSSSDEAIERLNKIPVKVSKAATAITSMSTHQDVDAMKSIRYSYLSNKALLSYLMRKNIDLSYARKYCCEVHYEYQGKKFYGLAFRNSSCGYEVHGTCFRGTLGSNDLTELRQYRTKRCNIVCVFSTFLDFLSYLTMGTFALDRITNPEECDYIILHDACNIIRTTKILRHYPLIQLYLTNDLAGQLTYKAIKSACGKFVINVTPRYKDYRTLNNLLVRDKIYQRHSQV